MAEPLLPFERRGPAPLRRTPPLERTTSDGKKVTTRWSYPWYPGEDGAHDNATQEQVRRWLTWVFQHSKSWVAAGIWFPEARRRQDALVVIRYVAAPFRCGNVEDAWGCARTGEGPDGQALIKMARQRLGTPESPRGWHKGILHEMAHIAFDAEHGEGMRYGREKLGILAAGSPAGLWPTEVDVASLVAYTQGRNIVV
jgi:hypothetical protein